MITSAKHIDEIRHTNSIPHLIHLALDETFRQAYRNEHFLDRCHRNLNTEVLDYRNRDWWNTNKAIPNYIRARLPDHPTQRDTSNHHTFEDSLYLLLGDDWPCVLAVSDNKSWISHCRNRCSDYLRRHSFPPDPRLKAPTTEDNTTPAPPPPKRQRHSNQPNPHTHTTYTHGRHTHAHSSQLQPRTPTSTHCRHRTHARSSQFQPRP